MVLLVLLAAVVLGAWRFGVIDHYLYLFHLHSGQYGQQAQSGQTAPADVSEEEAPYWYAYSQLSDYDCEKYLIMLDAFTWREAMTYPETDVDDLARIRDCVIADHPELFYIGGVEILTATNPASGLITDVVIEGQYLFSEEEIEDLQYQIDEAAAECLAGMPEDAGDYEKAKYLYEYLAANVEYNRAAAWGEGVLGESSGQTIADSLAARSSLCAGYARAYQYLLEQVGVPCVYVTGEAKGGGHAWCVAFLDGNWYHIDPTWGDPQFLDEGGDAADLGLINYDYLCVTDDDVAATHVTDCAFPLPTCTATYDNYYIREGLYLAEADVDAAGAIIQAAVDRGDTVARFRCADDEIFDQVSRALFDGRAIYRFIPGYSCSYVLDDAMRTVEVLFD